jgi:hypothetical protein
MNVIHLTKESLELLAAEGCIANSREQLAARLLTLGGEKVVWQEPEPHADLLLSRGRCFDYPVKKRPGQRSRCHRNSVKLWAKAPGKYHLVTGFALKEGLWRPHSWVLTGSLILETTVVNERYHGVQLTDDESLDFWWRELIAPDYPDATAMPDEVLARYPAVRPVFEERCCRVAAKAAAAQGLA